MSFLVITNILVELFNTALPYQLEPLYNVTIYIQLYIEDILPVLRTNLKLAGLLYYKI